MEERVALNPAPSMSRSLAARGIAPGVALQLHVHHAEGDQVLSTILEHVADDRLEILVPIFKRRVRPSPVGAVVRCDYTHQRRSLRFVTVVSGHSADGVYEYLALPQSIEDRERRGSFRLVTSIQPIDAGRIVEGPVEGETQLVSLTKPLIVDLSDGGLCIGCQDRVLWGDRLHVRAPLGDQGEFSARLRAVTVDEPAKGYATRKAHCQFEEITRPDRDRIARYIIARQIEMRRAGKI